MSTTQNEFDFDESKKSENNIELPQPTNQLNTGGGKAAHTKPKKHPIGASKVSLTATAIPDRKTPPITLFLSDQAVARRYSVSRATIWRWVNEVANFPHPVKITKGTTRWHIDDLEKFESVYNTTSTDRSSDTLVTK